MADLDAGIIAYLTGHAALSALVGSRVYPVRRPKGTALPAITFQRITETRRRSHDGDSGLGFPFYQFNVWAATHESVRQVADVLRSALAQVRGSMGLATVPTVELTGDTDDWFSEMEEYRIIVGARLHVKEILA